jgi:hypothetical protein
LLRIRDAPWIINQKGDAAGAIIPGFRGWYSDPRNAELNGSTQVDDGRFGSSLFMKLRPLQRIGR